MLRFLRNNVAPEDRGGVDEGGRVLRVGGGSIAVEKADVNLREFNVRGEVRAAPMCLEGGEGLGDPGPCVGDLVHEPGGGGVRCVRQIRG